MSGRELGKSIELILFLFILVVILFILSWTLGWIAVPLSMMSPDRIMTLSRQANEHYESLEVALRVIDQQEGRLSEYEKLYGDDYATWPQGKRDEYQQTQRQLQNLISAYNESCATYRALWNDEWRNIPAPDDLPKTCQMVQ